LQLLPVSDISQALSSMGHSGNTPGALWYAVNKTSFRTKTPGIHIQILEHNITHTMFYINPIGPGTKIPAYYISQLK